MLPLAFGLATATRVGNLIGEQRLLDAEFSTRSSLLLCFVIAIITTITIYTFREFLVSLYTNDPQVIALGVSLLLYAAIFQIPDGVQMSAVGSLRGFKDTFVPMILILISYWIIALPAGFVMTYGIIGPKLGSCRNVDWYDFRSFSILFAWNFTIEKGCRRKPQDISDFIVEPISRRFFATTTPLSFSF